MLNDFLSRFRDLLTVPTSTITEWRDLARDLLPEHFAAVVEFTKRSNPATDQGTQRALQTFAVEVTGFRDFLAEYAEDASNLTPNVPTFGSRIILRALVEAAKLSSTTAAPAVFRALAAHRAYDEVTTNPTLPSTLGGEIRQRVREQFSLVAALPPPDFVRPFSFVLRQTQKPLTPFAADFDDRVFLLDVLHRLTDAATMAALDWQPDLPGRHFSVRL
jgi:hypothetical protein